MNIGRYSKFIVAVAAALGVLATGLSNGTFGAAEIVAAVVAGLGALGVYGVKNTPPGTP